MLRGHQWLGFADRVDGVVVGVRFCEGGTRVNLKLEMLRVLDVGSDAILFPAATLLNQVRLVVKPTPTYAEFDKALLELETQRLIVGVRDGLDAQVVKYKLTDAGKAKLAEY